MESNGILMGEMCILIENHARNENPSNDIKKYRKILEEFKDYAQGFEDYSYNKQITYILNVHNKLQKRNIDNKIDNDTSSYLNNNPDFIKNNTEELFKLAIITDFIFNHKGSKTKDYKKMSDWLNSGIGDCNIYTALFMDYGKVLGLDIKPAVYYGHSTTYLKLSESREVFIETRTGLLQPKEFYNITEEDKKTMLQDNSRLITSYFEEDCYDYLIYPLNNPEEYSASEYKNNYEKAKKYVNAALNISSECYFSNMLNIYLLLIDLDKKSIETCARNSNFPKYYLQETYRILAANKRFFIKNAKIMHPKKTSNDIENRIDEILASIKKILDTEK